MAVTYIHQNLDKPVSVERLAEIVHMGQTSFYENFRKVMHVSPLQYAKSVKLNRAQALIKEGKQANEAGYLVGYNSPVSFAGSTSCILGLHHQQHNSGSLALAAASNDREIARRMPDAAPVITAFRLLIRYKIGFLSHLRKRTTN